jgi:hypothetical protein
VGLAQNTLGHEDKKKCDWSKMLLHFSFLIIFTHSSTPTISLGQNGKEHRYAKTILATKKVRELALRARFFSFGRVAVLDFCS